MSILYVAYNLRHRNSILRDRIRTIRFGPEMTGAVQRTNRQFVHLVPDFVFDGSLSVESSGITFVIVLVR